VGGVGQTGRVDNVTVREATDPDIPAVAALRWEWMVERYGAPADLDQSAFTTWFKDWAKRYAETHPCVIAERDGAAIGMAWIAIVPRVPTPHDLQRASADIQSVYVIPSERGKGIGRALADAVVAIADEHDVERVTVHSSAAAIGLYRRTGFAPQDGMLVLDRPRP
jgi:ribosomal protein S18 acetylase RimI-like enzyme